MPLTTGVDTFTGNAGDDVFNAVQNATTGAVLGGLDVLVGGAGNDSLNVSDTQGTAAFTFGGASITGIETVNVTTNGDFTGLNISAMTGWLMAQLCLTPTTTAKSIASS
jgi:hypothetical protein